MNPPSYYLVISNNRHYSPEYLSHPFWSLMALQWHLNYNSVGTKVTFNCF